MATQATTFEAQLDPLTVDTWQRVDAQSIRHAAAKLAATKGPGVRTVWVVDPAAKRHANGRPFVVHRIECEVGVRS